VFIYTLHGVRAVEGQVHTLRREPVRLQPATLIKEADHSTPHSKVLVSDIEYRDRFAVRFTGGLISSAPSLSITLTSSDGSKSIDCTPEYYDRVSDVVRLLPSPTV
jgi:hypothetical protein